MKLKELPEKINGLEVIKDYGLIFVGTKRARKARFICHCGNEFDALVTKIKSGIKKSCGCHSNSVYNDQTNKKHKAIIPYIKKIMDGESYTIKEVAELTNTSIHGVNIVYSHYLKTLNEQNSH